MNSNLKLIVLENCKDLGSKVNDKLNELRENKENYIIPVESNRFSNGEGKMKIESSVRDKDLYILSDVGNYSLSYTMHGHESYMSPDDHFQDIKRVISATSCHASRITLIMPLLYQSRQHKRKNGESLDCAIALQELEQLGIDNIITFDAHDPNVSNAIPKLEFENFYPTHTILNRLVEVEKDNIENLLVVSPDMGAMERARYYAEMLGCDVGAFYKRRDLTKVVNGKNPIVDHVYMGTDVEGRNIIVVDDMIASGGSMVEVARELRKRGAKNIYLIATFALLTEGAEVFINAYNEGLFNKLYATNLSYVPDEIKKEIWYEDVDCSMQIAEIVDKFNNHQSIEPLFNNKKQLIEKIERIKNS
jgi:ribose-phosphate pyrophosphokinase